MNDLIQKITQEYISDYLEDSQLIDYTELKDTKGYSSVFMKDLPNTNVNGYPVASDIADSEGNRISSDEYRKLSPKQRSKYGLRYHYLPHSHELYLGTTGSGKTTGCIEPQLRALAAQKNKPHLFFTDPKGELFDRNAEELKAQGYRLFVLNFKNFAHSHKWNPLAELYDEKMKSIHVGDGVEVRKGMPDASLLRDFPIQMFKNGYYIYNKQAFPSKQELLDYIRLEKDIHDARVDDMINQLANMFIQVKSSKDPTWEYGSIDLLTGILLSMLDDAVHTEKTGFTREMMNIRTIQQYYTHLRDNVLGGNDYNRKNLDSIKLLQGKSDYIMSKMRTALDNAPNTMRSYCGVFDSCMKDWFLGHIFALTSTSTVDLDLDNPAPFAIFVITRDYEKSDFRIAGLFVDWVYRKVLEYAEKRSLKDGTANTRTIHFLLDEFGNIPEIKDFENKISTSRSRNIWFHLAVQSYSQIDLVYDADGNKRSQVIEDNCNSQIFLGAQNQETKERFSKQCGNHSVESFKSALSSEENELTQVPLVPVSDLDLIEPGKMYMKRTYMPTVTTQYVRSYICSELGLQPAGNSGLETCTPIDFEPYSGKKYSYAAVCQTSQVTVDIPDLTEDEKPEAEIELEIEKVEKVPSGDKLQKFGVKNKKWID